MLSQKTVCRPTTNWCGLTSIWVHTRSSGTLYSNLATLVRLSSSSMWVISSCARRQWGKVSWKAAYEVRFKESQKIAISLADSRIAAHGPFLSNPFYGDETQQKTWLTTIIKKEKSKMGSTGNKRKIVTPTDILDRNATFYNLEIEHLLEGLPGSEFCADYVFYDLRGNGASQYSFVHEVKLRKEREKMRRKKPN